MHIYAHNCPEAIVCSRVATFRCALETILSIEFHPLWRFVLNKVVRPSEILPLPPPALQHILFQLVQMLFNVPMLCFLHFGKISVSEMHLMCT